MAETRERATDSIPSNVRRLWVPVTDTDREALRAYARGLESGGAFPFKVSVNRAAALLLRRALSEVSGGELV